PTRPHRRSGSSLRFAFSDDLPPDAPREHLASLEAVALADLPATLLRRLDHANLETLLFIEAVERLRRPDHRDGVAAVRLRRRGGPATEVEWLLEQPAQSLLVCDPNRAFESLWN